MKNSILASCALITIGTAASATTIGNTTFDFRGQFGANEPQTTVAAQLTAGAFCDPFDGTGCDGSFDFEGSLVSIDWVDGDSFDIGFFGTFQDALSLRITGLMFADSAEIESVTFNLGGADPANFDFNLDGFLAGPGNPTAASEPSVSTNFNNSGGLGNIFVQIGSIDPPLWGDGPTLRFDVDFVSGVEVVPLPAGGALLLSGLAGFAALRRKARQG